MTSQPHHPLIDIGANLADPVYQGVYYRKRAHAPDLEAVLARARAAGVGHCILTCGCREDFDDATAILERVRAAPAHDGAGLPPLYRQGITRTLGFHPTRSGSLMRKPQNIEWLRGMLSPGDSQGASARDDIVKRLRDLHVVALGEFGLDYDRLNFSPKEEQKEAFRAQLEIFSPVINTVPMFLHSRSCADDFLAILKDFMDRKSLSTLKGVVHSYTGSLDEARTYLDLGLDIGVNGCSLKTQEQLDTVAALPLSRLHVETDCPWCEIRRTHASYPHLSEPSQELLRAAIKKEAYSPPSDQECRCPAGVKGRMEPMHIQGVVDVLASISADPSLAGKSAEERRQEVRRQVSENSMRLFFPG